MAAKLPNPSLNWAVVMAAVALIAECEGCRLTAYRCPAGVATIGWGQTAGVRMGMVWTQDRADQDLCDSIEHYSAEVRRMCTVDPTPNELGALTALAYNIGLGALAKSSVLKAHNAGNQAAAARAFGMWNRAKINGVSTEMRGLTARRAAEAALYLKPDDEAPREAMVQAVAPQTSVSASPIAQSGAVTAGAGVLTLLKSVNDGGTDVAAQVTTAQTTVTTVSGVVDSVSNALHVSPGILLAAALLVAGAVVVWNRMHQRAQGWA